jgi:hypothetical protein
MDACLRRAGQPIDEDRPMNDSHHPLLSVRGDARQAVAPDYAVLTAAITLSRTSKQEATHALAASLDRLTADLAGQGGAALDVDTERHPLTWSAQSGLAGRACRRYPVPPYARASTELPAHSASLRRHPRTPSTLDASICEYKRRWSSP